MTMPGALVAALEHQVLVGRPRSMVFHAFAGSMSPSGRTSRGARPACGARTRPLLELGRLAMAFDLGGRRLCGRCSARLSATARRAEQPPTNLDAHARFYAGVTLDDLWAALAIASTVDETYAVGTVANQLHGRVLSVTRRRPTEPEPAARFDFEVALLKRRDHLRACELSPEVREARAAARAADAERDARIRAERRRGVALDRAVDRSNRGRFLTRADRDLIANPGGT